MTTHVKHIEKETFYFVTFTCYKWLDLIEKTKLYDYFKDWIGQINKKGIKLSGYVIMPNHFHLLLYVESASKGLNFVIGEAKRFMAYEIVKRLKCLEEDKILNLLTNGVRYQERKKGKLHQVFRLSFDAKEIEDEKGINQVLDYMHQNPVNGKWQLVDEYINYPYSSAMYYDQEKQGEVLIMDYRKIISGSPLDDPEG